MILDACRYDVFESHADLAGQLQRRESRAASTPEFVRANFTGRLLEDTVYVTGNSWFFKLRDEIDTTVHAAFHEDHGQDPEPLTNRAIEVADDFDDKRLLIHYIPPHHPFAGPTAEKYLPSYEEQLDEFFARVQRGELDVKDDVLRRAYIENLERVLPEVKRLLQSLSGKSVVSADHGELLGERCRPLPIKEYGHHYGLYVDELVSVPWLVQEYDERREIVSEPAASARGDTPDKKSVDERLRNLGYRV